MNEPIFIKQEYDSFSGCVIKHWKQVVMFGYITYYTTIHYR